MDYYDIIARNFQSTIEAIAMSVDDLATPIELASQVMTQALLQDRKIIACGIGADAALAKLLCTSLMGSTEQDRPALPAFCLSPNPSSLSTATQEELFSRQLRALGQEGDVLVTINSGVSQSAITAVRSAAHQNNIHVIALSSNSEERELSDTSTAEITLMANSRSHNQNIALHTMTLNILCQLVEFSLFGSYNQD